MSEHVEWVAPASFAPPFEVKLAAPDLSQWRRGNTGIPGFWRFASGRPGPHVVIVSLVHGNEIAGAVALDRFLRAGGRPAIGTLTAGFANLEAFDRFDPSQPTASRFVDEDLNRLWDESVLDGPHRSVELARARAMRPIIDEADILLDLHSMLWPSEPLILCGPTTKGRDLALAAGTPPLVVADHGHASGRRLIDYAPFTDPAGTATAILVEAGQHWQLQTVDAMSDTIAGVLECAGLDVENAGLGPRLSPIHEATRRDDGTGLDQRCAEVTVAVTANTAGFAFVQPFRGGDVVPQRDTLIAVDGPVEIRTPYDDCLLVMPSLRPSRGHTAVRLARFV